jgi:hypothetical protein
MKKCLCLIVIVVLVCSILVGCAHSNLGNHQYTDTTILTDDPSISDMSKIAHISSSEYDIVVKSNANIDVSMYRSYDMKYFIVCMKNTSLKDIGVAHVNVSYFDAKGQYMGGENDSFEFMHVKDGCEAVGIVKLPLMQTGHTAKPFVPPLLLLQIDVRDDGLNITPRNDAVSGSAGALNSDDMTVDVCLTNNSTFNLDKVSAVGLFIKNNEPIAVGYIEDQCVEANQKCVTSVSVPITEDTHGNLIPIEYDEIKIVVNAAYSEN